MWLHSFYVLNPFLGRAKLDNGTEEESNGSPGGRQARDGNHSANGTISPEQSPPSSAGEGLIV